MGTFWNPSAYKRYGTQTKRKEKTMKKLRKKDIAKLEEKGIKITISNDGLLKEKNAKAIELMNKIAKKEGVG